MSAWVYLDANGARVDPDAARKVDPATRDRGRQLHPGSEPQPASRVGTISRPDIDGAATIELLAAARSVPPSAGQIADWPAAWASDTIVVSHDAFAGLNFGKDGQG